MKYLQTYNESLGFSNSDSLEEALEIYAEELPFEMHDINIIHISMYDYRITYTHVDAKLNSRIHREVQDGFMLKKDFILDEDADSIEKIKDEVGETALVAFSKFARKYDMTCYSSVFVTIIEDSELDNDVIVEFLLELPHTENKLDESFRFSNESELKEALEIYAEELPFEMHDVDVSIVGSGWDDTDNYRVTYAHVDQELNSRVEDIVNDEDSVYEDEDDSIEKIEDEVDEITNIAFTKFAKKYDMIYEKSDTTIIDDDPNREYDTDIIVEFILKTPQRRVIERFNESAIDNLTGPEFEELVQLHLENPRINDKFEVTDVTFQSIPDYINTDGSTGTYKLDKFGKFYMTLEGVIDLDPQVRLSIKTYMVGETIKKIVTPVLDKIARMYDVVIDPIVLLKSQMMIDATYKFEIRFAVSTVDNHGIPYSGNWVM